MTQPSQRPTYGRAGLQVAGLAAGFVVAVTVGRSAFQESLRPAPPPPAPAAAAPSAVTAGGITLTSTSIDWPEDSSTYTGAGADLMNNNCTACHSASMALTQPPLSQAQWAATVDKMRNTYKAAVAPKDVPAIVDYLTKMSAQTAGRTPQPAQAPATEATGATG